ncbi:MAG: DUF2868 domain-containing protein [Comamonas sp.]
MKAQDVRDIVFAHAIETAAPNEALPNAARRDSITQEALHAIGKPQLQGSAGHKAFLQFLQVRAARIIQASQLPADVRQLLKHAPGVARWAPITILLAALVLGFVSHRISDPHRVDLLSMSLIGIVLWNVLVYGWLIARNVRKLLRPPRQPMALLQPTSGPESDAAPASSTGLLSRLQAKTTAKLRGSGLRPMALNFERNWWQVSQKSRHAQWLLWLHLGAAMMAVGALASLWITGLTKEYQIGWESTFLSAAQVQQWLNALFAPVQWLGLAPHWAPDEIQALQGWVSAAPGGDTSAAERWVKAYTALLAVLVIAPRLLLALWQGVRWAWLSRHMQLPLGQPYFANLQRDFGGLATQLVVVPYSLDITPERRSALAHYASAQYGAGVAIDLRPTLTYGAALPDLAITPPAQAVVLINLAATPEAEIHGELLSQLRNRYSANAQVWLWANDFAARNAGAPRRVEERTQLWQDFTAQQGLSAHLLGASSS